MTKYNILVKYKDDIFDADAENIKKGIFDLGIKKNVSVVVGNLYEISSNISPVKIKNICNELLIDPLTQQLFINTDTSEDCSTVDVYYKAGVTDSVAETIKIGIDDMGFEESFSVRTGKRYYFGGGLSKQELSKIAEKVLSNSVVQEYTCCRVVGL